MSNEPLGIYEELQLRAKTYSDHLERDKQRIQRQGPTETGAYAMPRNPFTRAIPYRLKLNGGYHSNHDSKRRRPTYPEAKLGLNIAQVVQAVAIEAGLTHGQMFSKDRSRAISWPRQVAAYLIDRYCPEYSLPEVAYVFDQDHTSVMHGIEAVTDRMKDKQQETMLLVACVKLRLAAIAYGKK